MTRRVGIVGRGRVGGAFAAALTAAGDTIVAQLGRGDDPAVLAGCELVLLAVPDAALDEVAARILPALDADAVLVHTSAARDLEPLRAHGDRIGIVHPATPVAAPTQPLAGVTFGVLATPASRDALHALVARIGGSVIELEESWRIGYHAALVHASNHLVALAADAATLLHGAPAALLPLLRQTLDNLERLGPEQALTGPVVRGDAETVRAHLAAIPDELRASYRENARRALALARRSGRLDEDRAVAVERVLDEDRAR